MKQYKTRFNDEEKHVELLNGGISVKVGEKLFKAPKLERDFVIEDENDVAYRIEDVVKLSDGEYRVHISGFSIDLKVEDPLDVSITEEDVTGEIHSPMAGVVTKILVNEGEHVSKGDHLLLLSAMKMENEIVSPIDGTVVKIICNENQQINASDLLVMIEPDND